MREAMGGALLIKLVMVFIVIYICFLSIAINYSITFRVKNQIINLIEAYEGYDLAKPHIESYVSAVGYYRVNDLEISGITDDDCDEVPDCVNGYCVCPVYSDRGTSYKITTYVEFDFPLIGNLMTFPISGETKVIYGA